MGYVTIRSLQATVNNVTRESHLQVTCLIHYLLTIIRFPFHIETTLVLQIWIFIPGWKFLYFITFGTDLACFTGPQAYLLQGVFPTTNAKHLDVF